MNEKSLLLQENISLMSGILGAGLILCNPQIGFLLE